MSQYIRGRKVEYEIKKLFEKAGFIVTRASASKSPYDLVATKITPKNKKIVYIVALCQVKLRKR